ncbi:MAG: hypothetical protein R3B06_28960 [Kofleriaceae bacterium]
MRRLLALATSVLCATACIDDGTSTTSSGRVVADALVEGDALISDDGAVRDAPGSDGHLPDARTLDAWCTDDAGDAGCGGDGGMDAGDGGMDAGDGGMDAGDGGMDAGDGGMDASDDGGMDAGDDGGMDAGDGGMDAGDDGGMDAGDDGGMDAGDGGVDAMTDGGSPDAPVPQCPPNPSCTDTSPTMVSATNPAGFCRPMCDGACQSDYWRWSFWVTQYNVSGTYGWGEHQGISIIGHAYRYDDRFAWNAPGAAAPPWRQGGALWRQGLRVSSARQFEMRTTNPSGETSADVPTSLANLPASTQAFCSITPLIDRPIYNHGRALARAVPTDGYYARRSLIPMRPLSIADQCRTRAGGWCRPPAVAHPTQIGTCMGTITDGACDSRCGNCSYVAIIPSAQGGSVAYWEDVEVAPRGGLTTRGARVEAGATVTYVGGVTAGVVDRPWVSFFSRSTWGSWIRSDHRRVDAPFTHCYDTSAGFRRGVDNPMEWVLDGSGADDAVTGRWGHNSNTDAELELNLFNGCNAAPLRTNSEAGLHAACGVCGTPVWSGGVTTQTPCRARTDTAALWWTRTSGIHNIDDWGVGLWPGFTGVPNNATNPAWRGAARPMPTCRWGGFQVWGM